MKFLELRSVQKTTLIGGRRNPCEQGQIKNLEEVFKVIRPDFAPDRKDGVDGQPVVPG